MASIARLARGERVACVSDAGTPAVSDPGAALVAAVREAGYRVVPIPGASSALAALASPATRAQAVSRFVGFLPARGGSGARRSRPAPGAATQVLFEAPHRIESLAAALAAACANRTTTLCRELTKQFETVATMPAGALPDWFGADANRARGEFVLVLHGQPDGAEPSLRNAHDALLLPLLAALLSSRPWRWPPRSAVRHATSSMPAPSR